MIEPLKRTVFILSDGKQTELASGIYTGAYSIEGSFRKGTVKAVGKLVRELKVGDRVGWDVSLENYIDHEGVRYVRLTEEQILVKLEEN